MSDPTVAFLLQPIETLAREGERFTKRVIHALRNWVGANHTEDVGTEFHRKVFVLGEAEAGWHMVMIVQKEHQRTEWDIEVCSVGFSSPEGLVEHFKPLADVDRLAWMMQVRLNKIEPTMFALLAESFAGGARRKFHRESLSFHQSNMFDLMDTFDRNAHYWASSKARNSFRVLLEDARKRPQVVEREDDDLFIVSRRYLQEAVEPTSAQGMSRRYLAMALSDAGMPNFSPRALTPLEDLPDFGSA